jgi:hypothetical protein
MVVGNKVIKYAFQILEAITMNQMQSYWQPNAKCNSNGASKIFANSNNHKSCQVKLITNIF